ncbi:MAG TPA: cytochrome c oxidase assembly protein [Isosphaeraceae bacterium]|jgi:cytochrome c oxidase assembly factor CtaG/ferredoxin|nr:cytochrome c oxidase assembly protein [Isosphaeraceae bacterium]
MSPTFEAFLRSWPYDPGIVLALALSAAIYVRGWLILRQRDAHRWHAGKLAAFLGGLGVIFLALGSSIEPFASLLLQMHMVQHMLLMMAAPPLLWLGAPLLPFLRGLPRAVRVYWVAPLFRSQILRRFCARLTHPAWSLPLFIGSTSVWHIPVVYDVALRSRGWHIVEHVCFLGTALVFWYPVVRPFPSRPRWSIWYLFPYLLLADVQNTILAALLTFSDRVLYASYLRVPRIWGISALEDQSAAGVIMWVPGSLAYLLPLFSLGIRLLFGDSQAANPASSTKPIPAPPAGIGYPLPILTAASGFPAAGRRRHAGLDVLRTPLLGRFLRWRHARLAFQIPLLVLAAVFIVDGLRGPRVSAMNLAGVLPWIHWRGVVVLGLLAAGNVSCMACPFMAPRTLARRWLPAGLRWPRRLRSKWLAVVLVGLFLWAYEALSLWDRPWWTAWIALGYFVAAFVIDGLFRGASFCKYVCPIGQFNFVQSLVSPLEVKVRDPGTCASCTTKDCIRGRESIPGCEMGLFLPRKAGNMDCTLCLDCIHGCPHENIGIHVGVPGRGLADDRFHSGIGRFRNRPDLAALILILVFGAFANAAGMVGPVVEWQARWADRLGDRSSLLVTTAYFLVTLLLLPIVVQATAATVSRRWGQLKASTLEVATRYAYAPVPLGFGMWLAHWSYHLLTSYGTAIPAAQRFAAALGWRFFGEPEWIRACCLPVADWLPHLQIVVLELGMLLSLYTGYRIAVDQTPRPSLAVRAFFPWALMIVLLFAVGVWIVLQPMQMRGTLPAGG